MNVRKMTVPANPKNVVYFEQSSLIGVLPKKAGPWVSQYTFEFLELEPCMQKCPGTHLI